MNTLYTLELKKGRRDYYCYGIRFLEKVGQATDGMLKLGHFPCFLGACSSEAISFVQWIGVRPNDTKPGEGMEWKICDARLLC